MNQIITLFLLLSILACKIQREDKRSINIDGNQLISIIENGTLRDFNNLIAKSGYHITDTGFSGISGIESVDYYSEDTLFNENKFTASVTKDLFIVFLSLSTNDGTWFQKLRKQFDSLGYKSLRHEYNIEELGKEDSLIEILMMKSGVKQKSYKIFLGKKI